MEVKMLVDITKKHKISSAHSGVVMIWVAMCLTVLLSLVALSIESARKTSILSEVQHASDAASVAAAAQLDGTVQGWRNAKRVAIAVLKNQTIPGVSVDLSSANFIFNEGDKVDVLETNSLYSDITARVGNLRITIERGAYWMGSAESTAFNSFEGKPPSSVTNSEGNLYLPLHQTMPTFILANAVQIKLEVDSVSSIFGHKLGFGSFGSMAKSSTSITDEQLEECVIPAAVPACALMLDLNPNKNNLYYTDQYQAGYQCQREFLVTEADPLGPVDSGGYYDKRAEGMLRSSLYPRFPYSSGILNKKALGLYGVLGVADVSALSGDTAINSEIVEAFQNNCKFVKIGSRFKPLENAVGGSGLYVNYGIDLTNILRLILATASSADRTIAKVFGIPGDLNYPAKQNYPYINSTGRELIRDFKTSSEMMTRVNLGNSNGTSAFTNPLCHDYGGSPANNTAAGVAQVTLMVIAPTAKDYYSNSGAYCDFGAVFGGTQANTTAPLGNTDPVVVGFVKADLFDFNVTDYGDEGSPDEDLDVSPMSYELVDSSVVDQPVDKDGDGDIDKDDEKILNLADIESTTREFVTQHKNWATCEEKPICHEDSDGNNYPKGCRTDSCDGKKATPPGLKAMLAPILSQPMECMKHPNMNLWSQCQDADTVNSISSYCELFIDSLWEAGKPSTPKKFCIPERNPDCTDSDDASCYNKALAPKAPQWGCGGLRMRLNCSQPALAVGRNPDQIIPAIVE
jgi:hypothetical protein